MKICNNQGLVRSQWSEQSLCPRHGLLLGLPFETVQLSRPKPNREHKKLKAHWNIMLRRLAGAAVAAAESSALFPRNAVQAVRSQWNRQPLLSWSLTQHSQCVYVMFAGRCSLASSDCAESCPAAGKELPPVLQLPCEDCTTVSCAP